MTREQREVHFKLSTTLPRRTHHAPYQDPYERGNQRNSHDGHGKEVIVNGKRYESMGAAGRAIGRTRSHIYYLIQTGKARYARP